MTITSAQAAALQAYDCTGSIRDSVFRGGTNNGIEVLSEKKGTNIMVERSEMSANKVGLQVTAFAGLPTIARISECVITDNDTGLQALSGGSIISYRDNNVSGNVADGAPTGTVVVM